MPAVSKKQQRYFGYLLSNPEERKKKGISKKAAKDFAQSVDEAIERQAKDRKKLSQPHSVSGSRRDHSHDVDSALTDHVPGKGKGRIRKASKKEMRVSAMRDAGIKQEEVVNEVAPPGWGHTKAEKEKTKPWKPKSKIGGSADAFKKDLDSGKFKGLPGDKTKKEKTASMFKLMWSMKKKGYKPHYKPGTDKKYKKYQKKEEVNEQLVSGRTKNWPKGSIDPSSKRERLAGDLLDLEKQDKAASWTVDQLRRKKKKAATNEATVMPNVSKKDKGAIDKRYKGLFKKDLKGTVQGVNEGLSFKKFYDVAKKAASKRQEMPKPKKADDAGARARRMLKRKEHQAKVSVIVPPELED